MSLFHEVSVVVRDFINGKYDAAKLNMNETKTGALTLLGISVHSCVRAN